MAGEGTVEQSSTPDGVAPSGSKASATEGRTISRTSADATPAPVGSTGGVVGGTVDAELTEADFRKDGNLRAPVAREISESADPRGAERSFNEVTGKTTVTTTVGGKAVTFEEDGDTRVAKGEAATDSAIRAFDAAVEADSEGV